MPPLSRKRRAPADEDAPPPTQTQRRPPSETPDDDEVDEEEHDSGCGSIAQLAKNLVRYALACEYSRTPIRRQDVNQKILGPHVRSFKHVFDSANGQLMDVFGMQMMELPNKEKVTVRQKRAAAATDQPKNSNTWVLQNILPDQYRTPDMMGPGRQPPEDVPDVDGAYIGLYTVVISLILLAGGQLTESKLERFLKRMNADQSTPVDATEKLLARMAKEGYIVKIKDSTNGEDLVDYMVGPRGKVEVGRDGVANFVRAVYGGEDVQDLEQRLTRSLGIAEDGEAAAANGDGVPAQGAGRRPGRARRRGSEDD